MADLSKASDGPSPTSEEGYDTSKLPDFDTEFIDEEDLVEFQKALHAPEAAPLVALNDWRPIRQRVRRKNKKQPKKRSRDETREGYLYTILKYPFLVIVFAWIWTLGLFYFLTRIYIYSYERFIAWRGKRHRLRKRLHSTTNYHDWVSVAKELDQHLGNEEWKDTDEYAYYDHITVRKARDELRKKRERVQLEAEGTAAVNGKSRAIDDLQTLLEACMKNNFAGIENARLYSETYFGTKELVQEFIDEAAASLKVVLESNQPSPESKKRFFKHVDTNFGRTALCLSGGAAFAYYHLGVIKALIDANLLPQVITGTSGGAIVAALVATRSDDELKQLLVPAVAHRITACEDPLSVWLPRWFRTGARFDSVDWARKASWYTRGNTTFREAYERTGRILNVSCVPSDPHSPTILANYLTSPDCVIWSAVLASAAVPGILNPIVLMCKTRDGSLAPYSFGHKWKDGSLRTDIPLKALNLHFNVNFSIVSQVNPHINLFFFSSRGTVGTPVTHRKGRGWRGGFLGSATEQYLKLDLNKWLKVLRHLELLPRPLGQDWSEIWLQRFSGTITIWPRSRLSDFLTILSDPTPQRLAYMLQAGQQSTFPKLQFVANHMKIERLISDGLQATTGDSNPAEFRLQDLPGARSGRSEARRRVGVGIRDRAAPNGTPGGDIIAARRRSNGVLEEIQRQSQVFFDDPDVDGTGMSEEDGRNGTGTGTGSGTESEGDELGALSTPGAVARRPGSKEYFGSGTEIG